MQAHGSADMIDALECISCGRPKFAFLYIFILGLKLLDRYLIWLLTCFQISAVRRQSSQRLLGCPGSLPSSS